MAKKLVNEVIIKYYSDNTIEVVKRTINNVPGEGLAETIDDQGQNAPSARISQILSVLKNSLEIYEKYPQMSIKQILGSAVEQTAAELGINKTSVYDKMNRQIGKNIAYWQKVLGEWLVGEEAEKEKGQEEIEKLLKNNIPNGKVKEDDKAITDFFKNINNMKDKT